ncbi:hypothetical protein Mapa_013810 [Marchantia paleacea]|nr:hypothetical protein Mapa_013810 [Marchantia paleacea]
MNQVVVSGERHKNHLEFLPLIIYLLDGIGERGEYVVNHQRLPPCRPDENSQNLAFDLISSYRHPVLVHKILVSTRKQQRLQRQLIYGFQSRFHGPRRRSTPTYCRMTVTFSRPPLPNVTSERPVAVDYKRTN